MNTVIQCLVGGSTNWGVLMRPLGVLAAALLLTTLPAAEATAAPPTAPTGLPAIKTDGTRLYDSATGATFRPRGANYIRLATAEKSHGAYHSTFEPGHYDPADAQAVLDGMQKASGYDTVRVFVDSGDGFYDHGLITGTDQPDGLDQAYLDNFADFVRRATEHGIYVLPTLEAFPLNPHYVDIINRVDGGAPNPAIAGNNQWYMDAGFIEAKKEYLRNFVTEMKKRLGAGTTGILAYSMSNEAFWETTKAPLNRTTGTFTGPDGVSYDMTKPDRRQQAADASMVLAANAAVAGVREADPDALTTIGFFTPHAVGVAGYDGFSSPCVDHPACRYPGRPAAVAYWSNIDFIDLHTYPGTLPLAQDLATAEVSEIHKPYVLGEFGALKETFPDVTKAAYAMRDLQVASCGLGAQGWLFWTYDTDLVPPVLAYQDLFWSLADRGGAINGLLAPVVRHDPCQA